MTNPSSTPKTPLREIIFSISFQENIEKDKIDRFLESSERIRKFNKRQAIVGEIEANSESKTEIRQMHPEFALRCESENKVIRIKKGLFSLHKIDGYVPFETLLFETISLWEDFIASVGLLTVKDIKLRYLNFIGLEANERIEDAVTIVAGHPFGTIDDQFVKLEFELETYPSVSNKIVAARAQDQGKDGVILDIILDKGFAGSSKEQLSADFLEMQVIKNYLYRKSITPKTEVKYGL